MMEIELLKLPVVSSAQGRRHLGNLVVEYKEEVTPFSAIFLFFTYDESGAKFYVCVSVLFAVLHQLRA